MVVVDSSVWIDYVRETPTPLTDRLDDLIASKTVLIGDLIAVEVLQGLERERDFTATLNLFTALPAIAIVEMDVAIAAARNYRSLRALGITIRKTIDTLIATRCIADRFPLLYGDRDFDPFVEHLGLKSAMA